MKQTINANIGGYPFVLDVEAYSELEDYLDIIQSHFQSSEGCEEIVHDIELRMAELLNERPNRRPIVTLKDVNESIAILGTPADFGAADFVFQEDVTDTIDPTTKRNLGKRFFRDPDEKVIAGVAGGLAQYFGVNDPLWIRLGLILFTFVTGGAVVLIYLILMVITPYAKTPLDRLAMRGAPINVQNIAKSVEESVEHITDRIDTISRNYRKKKH